MNKYIKHFGSVNESMKQHGIILIKGKPKGKNKEQMLFATHVNTWAELRPGAMMMFLSDTFYRIIKDGDKLKGVKINWRDEDSLKDALNFKAPGKLSVVRNNNKTPYHWKTLKHTNLRDALDSVEGDIIGSDYVFESSIQVDDAYNLVGKSALDTIFNEGKDVIVLDWDVSRDDVTDDIDSDETNGSQDIEWEATFDCLYVARPELDQDLTEMELRRFDLTIYFSSTVEFSQWYDPGDRDTPPDGGTEIDSLETEIVSVDVDGSEINYSSELSTIIKDMYGDDLSSYIKKKNVKFI